MPLRRILTQAITQSSSEYKRQPNVHNILTTQWHECQRYVWDVSFMYIQTRPTDDRHLNPEAETEQQSCYIYPGGKSQCDNKPFSSFGSDSSGIILSVYKVNTGQHEGQWLSPLGTQLYLWRGVFSKNIKAHQNISPPGYKHVSIKNTCSTNLPRKKTRQTNELCDPPFYIDAVTPLNVLQRRNYWLCHFSALCIRHYKDVQRKQKGFPCIYNSKCSIIGKVWTIEPFSHINCRHYQEN